MKGIKISSKWVNFEKVEKGQGKYVGVREKVWNPTVWLYEFYKKQETM